ncbi:MAG TPA: hypothetical protein PLA50_00915 [Bacteroidia bacterium]|nr:hypothetical protein [Bacteroidia bacterium]
MSELRSAFLPDDHEPQWGPVEELMRIAEDSFRAFAEELAPRVPRPLPTSAKVKEFLSAKCAALRESAPGYCSIRAVATFYDNAESPAVFFSAYHPTPGHSEPLDEIDAAIAWVAARTDGRSESDLVREQIANLTRRAEALEAEGK